MDQLVILIFLFLLIAIVSAIVLPIIALVISVRTKNRLNREISLLPRGGSQQYPADESLVATIRRLESRLENIESQLTGSSTFPIAEPTIAAPVTQGPAAETPPPVSVSVVTPPAAPPPTIPAAVASGIEPSPRKAEELESIIGRRWLGWAAVCVILFAAAFFLKYAFDNRWIGELGRVAIGVAAGITMTVFGYKYHQQRWRVFSQILTAGGIVLLYLSAYAAFGYYHLATQKSAFIYLAILVAEAAGLAYLYNAPAIAIMALIGGFLTPILLHSDRDQYLSLFTYIVALDLGALALLKRWPGLSSLAFAGTHLLFWLWYGDHYHPQKLLAVMIFQTVVFLIFLFAHLGRRLGRRLPATFEHVGLLALNPFVFFSTSYFLLNAQHHDWMGTFAIGMALVYAGAAKLLLDRSQGSRTELLVIIGVALTFVTIAIPIQLRQNWITIAWSVEALGMLWVSFETRMRRLLIMAYTLFGLTLIRLVFWDTPGTPRRVFTPILNRYFISSVIVVACFFGAAALYKKVAPRKELASPILVLLFLIVALVTLWFVMSVETLTFFGARASVQKLAEDAAHERWLGQMALSIMWSLYAAILAAIGFIRRSSVVRWASLTLFAVTVVKAMLVDIAELQQLYRIIVFFVLGMLLLVVAWGYHRAFHSGESAS
jgi:uncharacterized membrane protein